MHRFDKLVTSPISIPKNKQTKKSCLDLNRQMLKTKSLWLDHYCQ